MKKIFFATAISLLISLFSRAQKLSIESINVKELKPFHSYIDTTTKIFNIDSQGYKQGPFVCLYKNKVLTRGTYKNGMLVDSCFWYTTDGQLFAKSNFTYKNDYSRTISVSLAELYESYFVYLDDTLIIYNHPSDYSKPSVLVFKNNLKHGVCKINSEYGFENVFTYKEDTLDGYFKNAFHVSSNGNSRYDKQHFFLETGKHWNGKNSYDDWYYKYEIKNKDTVLIQKTLYNKNIKLENYTYYNTSGNEECLYYYSKNGIVDSILCSHEDGNLKSILHYDSNGNGIQYNYNKDGQLIKKASYYRELLNGYVYEYSNNVVNTIILYKNDTLITKELITNNNIVWQRFFYKNNEVEKVDWFNNKGVYVRTTCCDGALGDVPIGTNLNSIKTYQKYAPTDKENDALILYKHFPIGHKYYSENYFNYSDMFVISKRDNNILEPNVYYRYVLAALQVELIEYVRTEEGKALSNLKVQVSIVVYLSLLESDAAKGFTSVQLNKIIDTKNKKLNKAVEKFFTNRTIPYSAKFFENEYIECTYTIYPD